MGAPHWEQASRSYRRTILKTTDSGATWTNGDNGIAGNLQDIEMVSAGEGWMVGDDGTILAARQVETPLFADGFESGTTSAWPATVP